jgi:hypothetical protein
MDSEDLSLALLPGRAVVLGVSQPIVISLLETNLYLRL